ncbi:MAG: hypothetical protein QW303_07845 [Nitrososphaerota archaeon]
MDSIYDVLRTHSFSTLSNPDLIFSGFDQYLIAIKVDEHLGSNTTYVTIVSDIDAANNIISDAILGFNNMGVTSEIALKNLIIIKKLTRI